MFASTTPKRLFLLLWLFSWSTASGGEPASGDKNYFVEFSTSWRDDAWLPRRSRRGGYMRDGKDAGWQLRMRAFHQLVSRGEASIKPLLKTLAGGNEHQRILAAQTLGFLGKGVPPEPLLETLKTDASAAVRLYAVDSLGMLGRGGRFSSQLERIQGSEKNRDVRRHIAYALERKGQGIKAEIVDELVKWKPNSLDQAAIGKEAPDFELTNVSGEKIKLSTFRGKKAAVLVFIYGSSD